MGKTFRYWGPLLAIGLSMLSFFQNCSPVEFKQAEDGLLVERSSAPKKNCELEKRSEGETWMSAAGQEREMVVCEVGTGNQFKVFDVSKEMRCSDGTAVETGRVEKTPKGLEGLCDLNCGTHKNGELWWIDMGTSSESLQCPTSTTETSTVKYTNVAEYKCTNGTAAATGNTDKKRLEETACPPLTFNDQDNQATLAFEDIYPTPLDSDYNDFVTNIKVVETYSSIGELTKIMVEYTAKHIGGDLPHKLVTVFDGTVRGRDGWVSNQNIFKSEPMFKGSAKINVEYFKGGVLTSTKDVPTNEDLIVFNSTSEAANNAMSTKITITGFDGKLNLLKDRKGLSIKRYRTLLYVPVAKDGSKFKTYDIDISDINPSAYDEAGNPLAFFVPINWKYPNEGTKIKNAYPDFPLHAEYLRNSIAKPDLMESTKAKNWFNNVILDQVQQ